MTSPEFTVAFGKTARTIVHESPDETLVFTFDVGAAPAPGSKWTLYLDPRPIRDGQVLDQEVVRAREHVVAFASSCGYVVQVGDLSRPH